MFFGHRMFSFRPQPTSSSMKSRQITVQRREKRKKKIYSALIKYGSVIVGGFVLWKVIDAIKVYNEPDYPDKPRIVILGTGFGALAMASRINTNKFKVSIVSPRAYFMYTPMLPATTTGSLPFECIVEPVRHFALRTKKFFQYYEASCQDIDIENNKIYCKAVLQGRDFTLDYDYLIIAVGGYNETHNTIGVDKYCNFLNSLNDARRIRNRIIDALEIANLPQTPEEERKRLLHFVVVGGGPIARETACRIHDFVQEKLKLSSPELLSEATVSLVKLDDHIHNYYDYAISNKYAKKLKRKSFHTIADRITKVDATNITFKDQDGKTTEIPYGTCVWATGKTLQPLAQKISEKLKTQDNSLALVVDPTLKLMGTKNVYAIGDCATINQKGLLQKWEKVFEETDLNKDGEIDFEEFQQLTLQLGKKYPALLEVRRRAKDLFIKGDINKDGKLQQNEFMKVLSILDNLLTRFPSTASTAVQQGEFLGGFFNSGSHLTENSDNVFRYKHIGGYEYVGAEEGLVERGSKGTAIITGFGAEWMWTNVYYSSLVGLPMRLRVATNRIFSFLFGRDTARL